MPLEENRKLIHAGTTHAAALAGCPQLILPHVYDQFYWGRRVQILGIGVQGPVRAQLATESLIAALRETLQLQVARQGAAPLATDRAVWGSNRSSRLIESFS